jgi:hypothetical protein
LYDEWAIPRMAVSVVESPSWNRALSTPRRIAPVTVAVAVPVVTLALLGLRTTMP